MSYVLCLNRCTLVYSLHLSGIWTCLHNRGMCCSWRCLHHRGLSCIWTCLHHRGLTYNWTCLQYRGLCCSWMCLELHHRAGVAPELFTTEACAASRFVYTQGPELHMGLVGQQESVLLLDLSTLQSPVLHTDMSTHWGLSCIWMCLIHRYQCLLTIEHVRFALKIICLLSDVFASL
jgi:hypothetical protein